MDLDDAPFFSKSQPSPLQLDELSGGRPKAINLYPRDRRSWPQSRRKSPRGRFKSACMEWGTPSGRITAHDGSIGGDVDPVAGDAEGEDVVEEDQDPALRPRLRAKRITVCLL